MRPEDVQLPVNPDARWQDSSACSQVGEEPWFPEVGTPTARGRRVCREVCPVHADCLTDGMVGDEVGIWGGLTRTERRSTARSITGIPTSNWIEMSRDERRAALPGPA